ADVPAMAVAGGGLLVAAPLYLLVWLLFDGQAPATLTSRAGAAILYLGFVGSVVGFALFYYVLKRVAASRIALTTLVTPVLALWLGQLLNEETIDPHLWTGAALILGGLAAHQWGDALMARMRAVEVSAEEG